jgi:alkylation response protein AidB-like acyl-CoA dehydrogenase
MGSDIPAGGSFMVEKAGTRRIFTPEDFSAEQKAMAETASKFCLNEMLPQKEQIDHKEEGLVVSITKKAGELGLLMLTIPEEYDGLGMDKTTFVLVSESLAPEASSFITIAAHTCIGTQPLIFFGNEDQKKRYLPRLGSGEMLAAYALTETGAGSDAMSCKTRAVLSDDGKYYILNGDKQFITNGGIADLFTVFARVDGDRKKFSAFLVERGFPGFSSGVEEKKMGITGSSTTALVFEDCKVPVENLLGEIGEGGRAAFSVLDLGRLQVGGACAGGAKWLLKETIQFAKDRQQFNTAIIEFGMTRRKIADCMALIYTTESIAYRSSDLIDKALEAVPADDPEARKKRIMAIGNYAPECSVVKAFGSEALDMVADLCIQIFGGYGYIEEYPAEKVYRDSRINRIFEGTNEINRYIIVGSLLRAAMKGKVPILDFIKQLSKELEGNNLPGADKGPLGEAVLANELAKRIMLYCTNVAFGRYGDKLTDAQEELEILADMTIDCYCMDSAVCRALQMIEKRGQESSELAVLLTRIICFEGHARIADLARKLLMSVPEDKDVRKHLENLEKLAELEPFNLIAAKKRVAQIAAEAGEYKV